MVFSAALIILTYSVAIFPLVLKVDLSVSCRYCNAFERCFYPLFFACLSAVWNACRISNWSMARVKHYCRST